MMKTVKNIPELRFPEFEGEWNEVKLGQIATFHDSKRIPISDSERSKRRGKYPYYGASGIIDYLNDYIFDGEFVLLGEDGANIISRNSRLAFVINGKVWVNNHAHVIQAKNSNYFLAESLERIRYEKYNTGTVQPKLNIDVCKKILLKLPQPEEQQKIASFLSSADQRIQLLTQKKEKLEQYKKGIMQQIFSQQLRFKDVNGKDYPEWEETQFGSIYRFISTNSLSREKLNYESGHVKNIHYGDIHTKFKSHFIIDNELVPYINADVDLEKINSDNFLMEGDLVIADASEDYIDIGKSIEICQLNGQLVLAGLHTLQARRKSNYPTIGYGGHMMKSNEVRTQIQRIAQGTKVLSIAANRISDISFKIPCEAEQQKIASFLSSLDQKISLVNQQIELTRKWKQGLLQKMFV